MNIKRITLLGILCLSFLLLFACNKKDGTPTSPTPSPMKNTGDVQAQSEDDTSLYDENNQGKENSGEKQSQEELEKSLAAYREERETMTAVKMKGGLLGFGGPNLEDYGLDSDGWDYSSRFDSRELNEAYGVAEKYVVEILKIDIETKTTVYPCFDPRIYAIYDDEDKGVASGYEADNIFVCEYCDNGTWKYLILVRDAKGEPWKVIHHGDSYKND
jgi:hypothetical protein